MEHVTETVEQVYRLYHQDIVHFFAEHLSDRDLCWDLCHEVFVRLLLAQAAGMSLGKPRRWLMRVATNLLVDTYRQRAVSRAQVVPLSEDLSVKLVDAKAFWSLIEREDLLERLTRTFRALPRKARLLLYWREFERLSVQEMAMQLKTTEAVVSTELWRARTQFQQTYLREHFQGLLHPDEEIFEHLVRLVPSIWSRLPMSSYRHSRSAHVPTLIGVHQAGTPMSRAPMRQDSQLSCSRCCPGRKR